MIFPLIIAFFLGITHYFSSKISNFLERRYAPVLSLSSGMLIALIFLEMLPKLVDGFKELEETIFIFPLVGFILFHLSEKYVYQHIKDKRKMMTELKNFHILGFFIEHFFVGFALSLLLQLDHFSSKIFITLPFFLITISSSISLDHIDKITEGRKIKILLSSSTLVGAITAIIIKVTDILF